MTNTERCERMNELKSQIFEAVDNNDFELYEKLYAEYRKLNNGIR